MWFPWILSPFLGGKLVQHVHNLRRHIPAHIQQLRRTVLRNCPNAPGLWQPLLYGYAWKPFHKPWSGAESQDLSSCPAPVSPWKQALVSLSKNAGHELWVNLQKREEAIRSCFFLLFLPVLRVSTNTGQWKEAASKVTHALVNIR